MTKEITPKISVVVLAYIMESEMVVDLIETLLNQTIKKQNYEIIVSSDIEDYKTGKNVEKYVKKYPGFFTYIQAVKNQRALKRNYGAKKAKAPIILFLDGDMLADKNLIKEHLEAHKKHDGSVLGFFNNVVIGKSDKQGGLSRRNKEFLEFISTTQDQNVFEGNTGDKLDYRFFYTGNVSVKKSTFMKIRGFDEKFTQYGVEDIDLGYRLYLAGDPLYLNRRAKTSHRYSPTYRDYVEKKKTAGRSLGYFVTKYRHLYMHFRITIEETVWMALKNIVYLALSPFSKKIRMRRYKIATRLALSRGFLGFFLEDPKRFLYPDSNYLR